MACPKIERKEIRNRELRWSIIEVVNDLAQQGMDSEDLGVYCQALIFDLPATEQLKVIAEAKKSAIAYFKRGGSD